MISIIIPTLNEEKIIEKTLKSLKEFRGDYEVIVSDGKSTDRTVEIARKYADKVVIYEGEARQTIAMGRNLGVSVASGEYLLFLDADIFIPNPSLFFPKLLKEFNEKKLVGATVFLKVYKEMATIGDNIFYSMLNYIIFINNNIFNHGASSGEFQMIRTETFKKIGGFNEKLVAGEDFDMFGRLSKVGRTRTISSLFVLHTGRRPHKVGWSKVLYSWFMNWVHTTFFKKSWSEVWEEIR